MPKPDKGGVELMRFNGKVAVITAAASGICRAAAGIIVKEGGLVVGIDTDEARLEKMSMELSKESAAKSSSSIIITSITYHLVVTYLVLPNYS